jgi:oligoribonuclease
MKEALVWIDLETTGLVPELGRILEIAMIITTPDLVPLAAKEALIGPPLLDEEIGELEPVVYKMHRDSGLLSDHAYTRRRRGLLLVEEADSQFAAFLDEQLATPGAPATNLILAGSTVRFDRAWVDKYMPQIAMKLHYRMADVSAMREFLRHWLPNYEAEIANIPQKKLHRAYGDLQDSIALAEYFRRKVIL